MYTIFFLRSVRLIAGQVLSPEIMVIHVLCFIGEVWALSQLSTLHVEKIREPGDPDEAIYAVLSAFFTWSLYYDNTYCACQ